MRPWLVRALFGLVALASAALGVILYLEFLHRGDKPDPAETLYALTLPDATGQAQSIAQWRGKPMVVNFWATWCPPCREEMPLFAAAARSGPGQTVQIVGIALDEAAKVADFAQKSPMPYPLLVGGMAQGSLMGKLGNSSQLLPFTVFLNADGSVHRTKLGELKAEELNKLIAELAAGKSQQK